MEDRPSNETNSITEFNKIIKEYFTELKNAYKDGDGTEMTGRTPLQNFMTKCVKHFCFSKDDLKIIHEGKQLNKSAPDFQVKKNKEAEASRCIETKKIETDMENNIIDHASQIDKYKNDFSSILFTNYREFWLLPKTQDQNNKIIKTTEEDWKKVDCFSKEDWKNNTYKINYVEIEKVRSMILNFFNMPVQKINRVEVLASELAMRCRMLRDELKETIKKQITGDIEEDQIMTRYREYIKYVYQDQDVNESKSRNENESTIGIEKIFDPDLFVDAYAQTISYGLLMSKLQYQDSKEVSISNFKERISKSLKLIYEIVKLIEYVDDHKEKYKYMFSIIESIIFVINNIDYTKMIDNFDDKKTTKHNNTKNSNKKETDQEKSKQLALREDFYIYFYELFLQSYDDKKRNDMGVYYTPKEIVRFIVKGIDDILKIKFNIENGLASSKDPEITILDFACGTGTFLLETMEQIFQNNDRYGKGQDKEIFNEHIVPHLFGFDFMISAYTIAHMRLNWYLESEKNITIDNNQRLGIYFTNTLNDPDKSVQGHLHLTEAMEKETKESQKIKKDNIFVIMGNPPYKGRFKSENNNSWINERIKKYKKNHGQPLKSQNTRRDDVGRINDDYMKFIRFAEYKMENSNQGVVSVITNHNFLTAKTCQWMRKSLFETFDQIYILDLQGSLHKKDLYKGYNESVFAIQVGVAITFFIKNSALEKKIFYSSVYGKKEEKFKKLTTSNKENNIDKYNNIQWQELYPNNQNRYEFFPLDESYKDKYNLFKSLDEDIFIINNTGILTGRDDFAFAFTQKKIKDRVDDLSNKNIDEKILMKKYNLKDKRDYKVKDAIHNLRSKKDYTKIVKCLYRPFDYRYCYYSKNTIDWPRQNMYHMLKDNLSLLVSLSFSSSSWRHVYVTNIIAEYLSMSNRGSENCFYYPLYLYNKIDGFKNSEQIDKIFDQKNLLLLSKENSQSKNKDRIENFQPAFREFIDKKYGKGISSEDIFFYIIAILHSPHYRKKYCHLLQRDLPKIPFVEDKKQFLKIAEYGSKLKKAYLFENMTDADIIQLKGTAEIDEDMKNKIVKQKIKFTDNKIYINTKQYFDNIDQEVWDFTIGSHQCLNLYLIHRQNNKENKDRILLQNEIVHVRKMIVAIKEIIKLMGEVDYLVKDFLDSCHPDDDKTSQEESDCIPDNATA